MSVHRWISIPGCLAGALACVPAGDTTHGKEVSPAGRLSMELEGADRLVSYAWDGGARIPSVYLGSEFRIDHGEAGLESEVRSYFPLNEGRGKRLHDGVTGRIIDLGKAPFEWAAGRYGNAVRLTSPAHGLDLGPETAALFDGSWTVSLWLRPESENLGRKRHILHAPGCFTLYLTLDGSVRVEFRSEPPVQMISDPLEIGEWNHVAVAMDERDFRQFRLVANASQRNKSHAPLLARDPAVGFLIGGERNYVKGFLGELDDLRIRGDATSTAELMERYTRTPVPGPHRLVLEYESGKEQVEFWEGLIEGPALSSAADWESGTLRHVVFQGGRLIPVEAHWDRLRPTDPPLARTTHPTIHLGEGRVFLFGGETRDTHGWEWSNTNDTWFFHTREKRWERAATEHAPAPRCHQSAAYSPEHGLILYAGGLRNDHEGPFRYDDTWVFHTRENRWEERHPSGAKLPPHANGGLGYHPRTRRFYLLVHDKKHAYSYDPDANHWAALPPFTAADVDGNPVEYIPGGSPMIAFDPQHDAFVVYGGGRYLADDRLLFIDTTALYDPEQNRFTLLDIAQPPAARVRSGFAYDTRRERFVLFGGVREERSQRFDDLWVLDTRAARWRPVRASNPPGPRGGYYGMAYDPDLDRFFLLCGRQAKDRFLDEVWRLSMDDRAVGEATYVFDRLLFGERAFLTAEVFEPGGSQVALRFRGSEDLQTWTDWRPAPERAVDSTTRYVQVEARLKPGADGSIPELRSLGFDAAARASTRGDVRFIAEPVTPFDP